MIADKSFQFALKIINEYLRITKEKKEFVLSKQLLRSGTSIGANVEEAIGAQSKADFIAKLSIDYKEARETRYWIRLLNHSHFIDIENSQILLNDRHEILRILSSIILSTKQRMHNS